MSFTEKMFGYALVCIGLLCILFAFYSMYNVFSNLTQPPEIFKMKSLSFSLSAGVANQSTVMDIALDSEVRKIVNMFIYYLFMLFIVMVGSKIGGLGVQLIKEIKVEMKS